MAAIAEEACFLYSKAVESKALHRQLGDEGSDLLGGLAATDGADADDALLPEADPGRSVLLDVAEVVADLPALEDGDEGQVRRHLASHCARYCL